MLGNNALPHSNGSAAGHNGGNGRAQSQATPQAEAGKEVSLQEVAALLFKNKWWILACFALVLLATTLYTASEAPEYQASSTILIKSQSASPQLTDILGVPEGTGSNVANEVEILKSRTIAGRVADKLTARQYASNTHDKLSLLQVGPGQELTQRRVTGRLSRHIQISPVARNVDLIRIEATSTMPEESALVADLYAREYRKYDREISSSRARKSREFLEEAVGTFEDSLNKQQSDLQSFLTNQQAAAPDAEAEQLLQQVGSLEQQRIQAQLQRGQAQIRLQGIQDKLDTIQPGLAEAITNNDQMQYQALQERITGLQSELEGLYANNPDLRESPTEAVKNKKQKIAALREQVSQLSKSLTRDALSGNGVGVSGATGGKLTRAQQLSEQAMTSKLDLQAAQTSLATINRELDKYKSRLRKVPRQKVLLDRLEQSLTTSSSVYEDLRKKLYDARIAEQSELGKVQIIDEAQVPRHPVRPKVPTNLALGGFLGLILGVGVAFMRNLLDNRVRSPEDLRRHGQNVLGTVPDMKPVVDADFGGREYVDVENHKYSTRLISLLNPLSPIAESYRHLRTNLRFSRPDSHIRTIMVTSAGPGEGKTVTATNLAVTMAQSGRRTLYLDADMRRSSGHRVFDVPREPGLVDVLFESYPRASERFSTDVENLHVMPTGRSVPNPAEVMGADKMQALLEQLRRDFDVIVIDTPPVLAVTDPLLMAEHCDAVLTVYSANETEQRAVERVTETLGRVDQRAVGAVLNRFDPKAAYGSYGYGYGYGYGEYGADEPSEQEGSGLEAHV